MILKTVRLDGIYGRESLQTRSWKIPRNPILNGLKTEEKGEVKYLFYELVTTINGVATGVWSSFALKSKYTHRAFELTSVKWISLPAVYHHGLDYHSLGRWVCHVFFQGFLENRTFLKSIHWLSACLSHLLFWERTVSIAKKFGEKVGTVKLYAMTRPQGGKNRIHIVQWLQSYPVVVEDRGSKSYWWQRGFNRE